MSYIDKKKEDKQKILRACPTITTRSGIYIFYRIDEYGIKHCYCGQAVNLLERCAQHLSEYDHIGLSLKKRGFYSEDNPYAWKLIYKEYDKSVLDQEERKRIKSLADKGYQLYNRTIGGQDSGKAVIGEGKSPKNYTQGLEQGYKNASKEISHLFEKHLTVSTKKDPPTKHQINALDKFNEFLNYHKNGDSLSQ